MRLQHTTHTRSGTTILQRHFSHAPLNGLLLLILLGAGLTSCQTGPKDMRGMAKEMVATYGGTDGIAGLSPDVSKQQEEHINAARQAFEKDRLKSSDDFLYAGYILMHSSLVPDVELARELCLAAAEMGSDKGLSMAAVATDDLLFMQGMPQRYGTKFVYEPFTEKWRMYAVDPLTKDEERRAMGLPTLTELKAELQRRNSSKMTKMLRKSGVIAPTVPEDMVEN